MTESSSNRGSAARAAFSLREAARERPDAPAIVSASGTLTFGDLRDLAAPAAHELSLASDHAGERRGVAVVAPLRLETILAIYALVDLGTPLVLIHPRLTPTERLALVEMAGARRLVDETWTPSNTAPPGYDPPPADVTDEDPLAVLFTSGSSGTPKGVELSRRAFHAAAVASAANLGWNADDRWLLCMPLAHVGGLSVVLRCLAARVPMVLSPWTGSLGPLLQDIDAMRATVLSLVPTMLARILEELPEYRFPAHVRAVLLGGDAASPALLATAEARGVPVVTTYGMTEACSQIATLSPGERPTGSGVGRPLPGTEVRILAGEIQARGPTLFTRYVPREKWPSPFVDGGWFATGDLGHLDDAGRLHVTGRKSDMIISGGENVDPREVEIALESCAGVRAACVFPVADERWGQIVAAAVVMDPHAPSSVEAIAAEAQTKLARHKWPRRMAVCAELTLNATGKLDRRRTASATAPSLREIVPRPAARSTDV